MNADREFSCSTPAADGFCNAIVDVNYPDGYDTITAQVVLDGAVYCRSCTDYHCAAHASKTHRNICAECSALGHGDDADLIATEAAA